MKGIKIIVSVLALALAFVATPNKAYALSSATGPEPWGEFGFNGLGDTSVCVFCTPSAGNNSFFLGSAPWTFTGSGFLIVQDAFFRGDRFEVFDGLNSLGLTSIPIIDDSNTGPGCGSDPEICFNDLQASGRVFTLDEGFHSFTIAVVQAPFGPGAAYLCIDTGLGECNVNLTGRDPQVPEPASMLLLAAGFLGAFIWVKRPEICRVLIRVIRKREQR
jgi:hypothetical protein